MFFYHSTDGKVSPWAAYAPGSPLASQARQRLVSLAGNHQAARQLTWLTGRSRFAQASGSAADAPLCEPSLISKECRFDRGVFRSRGSCQ
jgi:hypothetical protein